jgi:hypothetical protein
MIGLMIGLMIGGPACEGNRKYLPLGMPPDILKNS